MKGEAGRSRSMASLATEFKASPEMRRGTNEWWMMEHKVTSPGKPVHGLLNVDYTEYLILTGNIFIEEANKNF